MNAIKKVNFTVLVMGFSLIMPLVSTASEQCPGLRTVVTCTPDGLVTGMTPGISSVSVCDDSVRTYLSYNQNGQLISGPVEVRTDRKSSQYTLILHNRKVLFSYWSDIGAGSFTDVWRTYSVGFNCK